MHGRGRVRVQDGRVETMLPEFLLVLLAAAPVIAWRLHDWWAFRSHPSYENLRRAHGTYWLYRSRAPRNPPWAFWVLQLAWALLVVLIGAAATPGRAESGVQHRWLAAGGLEVTAPEGTALCLTSAAYEQLYLPKAFACRDCRIVGREVLSRGWSDRHVILAATKGSVTELQPVPVPPDRTYTSYRTPSYDPQAVLPHVQCTRARRATARCAPFLGRCLLLFEGAGP